MTTTEITWPLANPIPVPLKKKRVLLVDSLSARSDLRADAMRKLGMDVDCAADIGEARSWWKADLYDLVLIDVENGQGHRDRFCADIRNAAPPQQLAFLVGKPQYLADAPAADAEFAVQEAGDQAVLIDASAALAAETGDLPQRWGILEASRKISAVRSVSVARTQAMRKVPAPPRDSEGRLPKQKAARISLNDLFREEMQ